MILSSCATQQTGRSEEVLRGRLYAIQMPARSVRDLSSGMQIFKSQIGLADGAPDDVEVSGLSFLVHARSGARGIVGMQHRQCERAAYRGRPVVTI